LDIAMRRSEALRYARLSASIAAVVFLLLAGIYGWRALQHARSVRSAPPAVPVTVQQQSQKFSFSKATGDRTLFQVEASSATAFTSGSRSVLENVGITMFGQRGDRNDRIRTRECEYFSDTGRVVCRGDVYVELEAARDARERPGKQMVRAETSQVTFDRDSGSSHSDQPVVFSFPYGDGRAVGFTYDSNHAVVRLQHQVVINLRHALPGSASAAPGVPTEVSAASLEYHNEDGVVHLDGPVLLRQGTREVACAALTLELSPSLRARRMLATGRPTLTSRDPQGTTVLAAETASLDFTASGAPSHLHGEGSITGLRKAPILGGEQRFASDRLDVDFDPRTGAAHLAKADGNVRFDTPPHSRSFGTAQGSARLSTSALLLHFAAARNGRAELQQAESPVPATLEFTSPKDDTVLRARYLVADYGPGSHLRQVHAHHDVEVERRLPGQPLQVTRSDEGEVDFDADHWTEARQNGNVRFEEAGPLARRGRSERSRSVSATDTLTLTDNAELSDVDTDSAAPSFTLEQRTGEARGEGVVRTTYRRVDPAGVANFAPQPAHIMADRMTASRNSSRAVYSGHARLWQGDAVIQADTLELRREERLLLGTGNVSARLPQVQPPPGAEPQAAGASFAASKPASKGSTAAAGASSGDRVVWAVSAARLTYRSADAVAELDQNVRAESRLGRIASAHMDLILTQSNGVQQLSKAVCTGGATVWQQNRRGTADRADYTASDGRFVLSGGNPTLYDADQGTTTGRELTFFLADDRILIDSGNGTRTLSRHRIQ
jgi:lipopolysaccharide export system protein LptA